MNTLHIFQLQTIMKEQSDELIDMLVLVEAATPEDAARALDNFPPSEIEIKSYKYIGPVAASLIKTEEHVASPVTEPKVKSNSKSKKLLN